MRVKAIARGHFGVLREPGDEFEYPAKFKEDLGSWMEPADTDAEKAFKKLPSRPKPKAAAPAAGGIDEEEFNAMKADFDALREEGAETKQKLADAEARNAELEKQLEELTKPAEGKK